MVVGTAVSPFVTTFQFIVDTVQYAIGCGSAADASTNPIRNTTTLFIRRTIRGERLRHLQFVKWFSHDLVVVVVEISIATSGANFGVVMLVQANIVVVVGGGDSTRKTLAIAQSQ
jgi:hypothetical protein